MVTRWLDDVVPHGGRIAEPAAGVGFFSPLLAERASSHSSDPDGPALDRARDRLVAHGLRAHLHVADPWAGSPDRDPGGRRRSPVPPTPSSPRSCSAGSAGAGLDNAAAAFRDQAPARRPPRVGRAAPRRARRTAPGRPVDLARPRRGRGHAGARGLRRPRRAVDRPLLPPHEGSRALRRGVFSGAMSTLTNRTIATVGSGVMAEAMIAGLLRGNLVDAAAGRRVAPAARAPRRARGDPRDPGRREQRRRRHRRRRRHPGGQAADARPRRPRDRPPPQGRPARPLRSSPGPRPMPSPAPLATARSCGRCPTRRPASATG